MFAVPPLQDLPLAVAPLDLQMVSWNSSLEISIRNFCTIPNKILTQIALDPVYDGKRSFGNVHFLYSVGIVVGNSSMDTIHIDDSCGPRLDVPHGKDHFIQQ